jgi:hypothetical protein
VKATNKSLLLLLLGCALAYAFTIGVAPRSFSGRARQLKVQLDREAAIARSTRDRRPAWIRDQQLEGAGLRPDSSKAMSPWFSSRSRPVLLQPLPITDLNLLSAIVFNVVVAGWLIGPVRAGRIDFKW